MANGHPECLVASTTLASATMLPPAALSGHVMPNFSHTLIGLGPFADQDCTIVFTKTAVTVYHPDGHPILSGWRDETGPRLWHMLLHSGPLGLAHRLLNIEPLRFGCVSTKDCELMQLKTVQEGRPCLRTPTFGHLTIYCSP